LLTLMPTPAAGTNGFVSTLASTFAASIFAGCAVDPNYKRPPIDAPEVTRGQIGPAEAASLVDRQT